MAIILDNETDLAVDPATLEAIAAPMTGREIELLIVGDDEIRRMNNEFRGIDKATDVLSFPMEPMPHAPLGSIVISADHARAGASAHGHTPQEEFALLFIHGLLHLLGHDHETDEGQMRAEEERLIALWNLPSSLIVRTEEG